MDDTLQYLLSKIEDERNTLIENLADGGVKSFEEYKYVHGVLRGLLMSEAIILDLAKRMESSDE